MFILSFISSSVEFLSINHTSMYENSELMVFKNVGFLVEISTTWPKDLLGKNVQRLLNVVDNCCWHVTND